MAAAGGRDRASSPLGSLVVEPPLIVGDEEALQRLGANLIDNAVAWTPTDSAVAVSVRGGDFDCVTPGPGTSQQAPPHVFQSF